jgi:hypothetical protein
VSPTSLSRRALVVAVSAACLLPQAAAAIPTHDSVADHPGVKIAATTPADPQLVNGDKPSEYAAVTGKPRSVAAAPIEIVRPERTIIRDRVPSAPVVLAGLALVVALIGAVDLRARRRTLQARVH